MEISVYKTQGIILKKTDLNDTDRLLTIYSEKFGKILVRAKGIGKKESKLKSLIEPFNIYEFSLAWSKNIDVLAGSWPIKEFVYLRQNLENLSLAIYFAELVDKLVFAPECDDKIWVLLVSAFEAVDKLRFVIPSPQGEESPANAGNEVSHSREILRSAQDDRTMKLKAAFEEKLIEFLGHPNFKTHGNVSEREKLNYLQSLAGEEIKSGGFLLFLAKRY